MGAEVNEMKSKYLIGVMVVLSLATLWHGVRGPRTDAQALSSRNIHEELVKYNRLLLVDKTSGEYATSNSDAFHPCLNGVKESNTVNETDTLPTGEKMLFIDEYRNLTIEVVYDIDAAKLFIPREALGEMKAVKAYVTVTFPKDLARTMAAALQ